MHSLNILSVMLGIRDEICPHVYFQFVFLHLRMKRKSGQTEKGIYMVHLIDITKDTGFCHRGAVTCCLRVHCNLFPFIVRSVQGRWPSPTRRLLWLPW